jgi:adenosine deaminase
MPGNWPQTALLHDHGDGSITVLPKLQELYRLAGLQFPIQGFADQHELGMRVRRWFNNSNVNIVTRFGLVTNVLQKHKSLVMFAENYVNERASQGFTYCEMTIAPQYHTKGGLKESEVISALIEGIKLGEKKNPKIEVNILFTIGREVNSDEAVRLVNVAGECDRDYVVGIGLVCDEASHPPEKHLAMFKRAQELDFSTTCHAGEWVSPRPRNFEEDKPLLLKNIRTAVVDLGVNRVGHATALAYDSELVKMVVDRHIGIEGCPGSNFDSENIPNLECLKIRELLDAGVVYSLNPDDDLFLPDTETTFNMCNRVYNFTKLERELLIKNAQAAKFGGRKLL